MPDRADIDPTEMRPDLLPYLFIVELVGAPPCWRFRLAGTRLVNRLGLDPTGRFVGDVLGPVYGRYVVALDDEVRDRRLPLYTESEFRVDGEEPSLTKRMLVPLTAGGSDVAMILGAQTYHSSIVGTPHGSVRLDGGVITEVRRRFPSEPA
jgi:hypothetical protein